MKQLFVVGLLLLAISVVAGCAIDRKDLSQNQKDILFYFLENPDEEKQR